MQLAVEHSNYKFSNTHLVIQGGHTMAKKSNTSGFISMCSKSLSG